MGQAPTLARKVQLCEDYHKKKDEYATRSKTEKTRAGGMRLFWDENERDTAHQRHGLAIPFTTWRDFYRRGSWHQDPNKFLHLAGGQPLLGRTAEVALMAFIIGMCALGFLLSPSEVKDYARDLLPAAVESSLKGWFVGFIKRLELHDGGNEVTYVYKRVEGGKNKRMLKVRKKPEGLSEHRARSLSPATVGAFAKNVVRPFLAEHPEITTSDIGGFDEFQLDMNAAMKHGNCVGPPGLLYTSTPNEQSEHVTILAGHVGNWATPLLCIFKGTHVQPAWEQQVKEQFPDLHKKGYIKVDCTETGWIDEELKLKWFQHVVEHPDMPNPTKPKLWIFE
jgi:hypothetical protein